MARADGIFHGENFPFTFFKHNGTMTLTAGGHTCVPPQTDGIPDILETVPEKIRAAALTDGARMAEQGTLSPGMIPVTGQRPASRRTRGGGLWTLEQSGRGRPGWERRLIRTGLWRLEVHPGFLARRQAAGGEVRTFFIFDVECCLCSCPADRAREREIRWRVYRENAYCWGSPAGSRRIKWPMWPARCARPERMSMSL